MTWLNDLACLFFPRICAACSRRLMEKERVLCLHCIADLPKTNFHRLSDNPVAQLFWGRVIIQHSCAFIFFRKHSKYQQLFHALKYKGITENAFEMGRLFACDLLNTPFDTIDVLIPVPLHPSRLKKRGYNQSEIIAQGMACVLNKPVITDALFRMRNTPTQTKKTRYDRYLNICDVFALSPSAELTGKHILLIDDVVTTGATLEQCALTLLQIPNVKISIATLGYATNN